MSENTFKDTLIKHIQRYPEITAYDCIKLIYQQTFGPGHFSSQPTSEHITIHIIKELKDIKSYDQTPDIEYIGNEYYRISLKAIGHHMLSIEDLTTMFFLSMKDSPKPSLALDQIFLKKIDEFLMLLDHQIIQLKDQDALGAIKVYLEQGIHATHHSDHYKKLYHPHYRVVHQRFMRADLIAQSKR